LELADGDLDNMKKRVNGWQVIQDIAEGIHYLHSRSPPVLHGDIKPLNILIKKGIYGSVCDLCDIGRALISDFSRSFSLDDYQAENLPKSLGTGGYAPTTGNSVISFLTN
jgi:serine/threonine protein kinase